MRVVHLSTYHLNGGAAVAATRLHRALLKHPDVDSTMLVGIPARLEPHQAEPGVVYLADNFLSEQMAFGRFVAERLYFLAFEKDKAARFKFSPAWSGAGLSFHPIIQQADVLHLHWINFGFLSLDELESLFALGKPIVWTLHDTWAFTGGCHYPRGCDRFLTHCGQCPYLRQPGERDLSYRLFGRKKAILADVPIYVTPPSRWLADEAMRSPLLRNKQFSVIPYAIDQDVFRPVPDMPYLQDTAYLRTNNQPTLLFGSASLTDPRKGFSYFAEALTLLKDRLPDSIQPEVLVFGKGTVYQLGDLSYPVRHLGVLTDEDQLVAAYNGADAMVVPSLEDNLPNTVIEALACGTPVIAFRTGGIPEMIDHTQNGYLADVGSAEQLADGLYWLLTHPDLARLRQNARQSAEERFSEPVVAGQFYDLYRSLLQ
ncbi:MAG: glycosyltransferase family 4 protein [Bacteroidetes bacterium]|nr:glycosyltransferase family 4 protein [Fibrella sp.]